MYRRPLQVDFNNVTCSLNTRRNFRLSSKLVNGVELMYCFVHLCKLLLTVPGRKPIYGISLVPEVSLFQPSEVFISLGEIESLYIERFTQRS